LCAGNSAFGGYGIATTSRLLEKEGKEALLRALRQCCLLVQKRTKGKYNFV